jgi:glycosyltransferase involved in cell wall biosynthesis
MRIKALLAYTKNIKKIKMLGIDVLYVHSPEVCLPFLFYNKKIPVIYHQHGFSNALHSSKYPYGEAAIFRKFFDFAMWLIYKKASWIVAIDPIGVKQAYKYGAKDKTSLLHNAIDTNHFYPDSGVRKRMRKRFGLLPETIALFNAGRIEKQKGLQRLFACMPLLKNKGLKFQIFIAGDGTYKDQLESLVKLFKGEADVTFLGRISHNNLPSFYNMADVFVLPSEKEGVPMAILESMACGTPVVANGVGGIPNFLKENVNGEVLKSLSKEAIVESILNVVDKKYDRQLVANSIEHLRADNAIKVLNKNYQSDCYIK